MKRTVNECCGKLLLQVQDGLDFESTYLLSTFESSVAEILAEVEQTTPKLIELLNYKKDLLNQINDLLSKT